MRPRLPRAKGIRNDKDRDTGRPEEKRDLLPEEKGSQAFLQEGWHRTNQWSLEERSPYGKKFLQGNLWRYAQRKACSSGVQLQEGHEALFCPVGKAILFLPSVERNEQKMRTSLSCVRKVTFLRDDYVAEEDRPIPFKRMIYFGDGETDIPCMKMVKQNGGYSIAVYNPSKKGKKDIAKKLISEDRVNFVCSADYKKSSDIYEVVTTILQKIKRDYDFDTLLQKHKNLAK